VSHVYQAPSDCALDDRKAWRSANPALGVFRSLKDLQEQAKQALRMPAAENTFRWLCLNQRIQANSPFVSRKVWLDNSAAPLQEAFEANPVYAGLDLSARQDLTALVLVAQDAAGIWHVRPYFWAPAAGLVERARRDRAPYDLWESQGYLETTPGASIDYGFVAQRLADIAADCDLRMVAYDRWRINDLRRELDERGISVPLVECGQGYRDMSPALDALEVELANNRVRHGGHPTLTWCAANAITKRDEAGNRKLDKSKDTGRIDGMVALAMAMGKARTVEGGGSVYDEMGQMTAQGTA
jgi:phage terminase large subunit-like protein